MPLCRVREIMLRPTGAMLLDKERRGIPYQSSGTGPRWTKEPQWQQLPSLDRVAERAAVRAEAATATATAKAAAAEATRVEAAVALAARVEAAEKTAVAEAAFKDATTTDLTTGIADWLLDDGSSSAPKTAPDPDWYQPTGNGKWLGNATTGEVNKVYGYTLSFEVNPPALPFPLLTSNL